MSRPDKKLFLLHQSLFFYQWSINVIDWQKTVHSVNYKYYKIHIDGYAEGDAIIVLISERDLNKFKIMSWMDSVC